ncbi:MAG: DNA translocase FtsK 4TM domain-containing protein, partial [Geminicoccaceae bacterium]
MAAPSIPRRPHFDAADFLTRRASEAFGIGLCLVALVLAVALFGFDAGDPSINHATSDRANNPLGSFGANTADLALQTIGKAIWFLVLVLLIWGVRLIINRLPSWSWLSIAALPPALLVIAAYLATLSLPAKDSWPYLVGLGGVVGDFALHRLEPSLGGSYGLYAGLSAIALSLVAIGISVPEIIQASQYLRGQGDRSRRSGRTPARPRANAAANRQRSKTGPSAEAEGPSMAGRIMGGLAAFFGLLMAPLLALFRRHRDDDPGMSSSAGHGRPKSGLRRRDRRQADDPDDQEEPETPMPAKAAVSPKASSTSELTDGGELA